MTDEATIEVFIVELYDGGRRGGSIMYRMDDEASREALHEHLIDISPDSVFSEMRVRIVSMTEAEVRAAPEFTGF